MAAAAAGLFALQWRNRIDQSQGFLRVVPVGSGQTNAERYAARTAKDTAS